MVKYIFDLDLTLYSEHDFKDSKNENEYYDSFRKKTFLKQLLTKLKGQKFLLTNANLEHTSAVLEKIGLMNLFKDVISSDIANSYKPYRLIYDVAIREFKIGKTDEVLYFEDLEENLRTGKKLYNWTLSRIPMKRWGTSNEVANLICFLLSDKSSYINGESINIDGGWTNS